MNGGQEARRTRRWLLVLATLAATAGCAADPDQTVQRPAGEAGSGVTPTLQPRPDGQNTPTTEPTTPVLPTVVTATSRVGNGLPQDAACQVVSWDDLPANVRHPTKPPTPVTHEDPELRKCRLDNSRAGVVVRGPDDPPGAPQLEAFIVVVLIGPTVIISPSGYGGTQHEVVTIDGRDGVRARGTNEDGSPWCLVVVPTRTTKLAVEVDNNRFQVNVCQLATQVAERVAPRL